MKFKKISIVLILTLVIISSSVISAAANTVTSNQIVAAVNGTEITLEEFYETLEEHFGAYVLSQMILDIVIEQKQEELGIYVDQEILNSILADTIYQLGGEQGYNNYLAQLGMNDKTYREQLEFELTLFLLSKAETTVTPEQIIEFFEENEDYFAQPEAVQASHILVETEAEAVEIITKLNSGAKFEELANEHSTDTQTKTQGGYLGYFGRNMMVPEFEELAFSLPVNTYNKVETSYGWHVVLVTDKVDAKPADLDAQWDEVEQTLIEYLASDLNTYIMKLEQEADVEILRERYR